MKKYVYPSLSNLDFGFFRLGGPGLANCMFVAARAYLTAKKQGLEMLRPTWERLGVGQWLRRETDKRFYVGLFRDESCWRKLRRAFLLRSKKVIADGGVGDYFRTIIKYQSEVKTYFDQEILPEAIKDVPSQDVLKNSVAIHIRLGDYSPDMRTPIEWYEAVVLHVKERLGRQIDFQLFSDGTDEELAPLLAIDGVHRVFYGNALADIIAISRCGLLIGSDSTFSSWGAFLGQVPCVFEKLHFAIDGDTAILKDSRLSKILGDNIDIPEEILSSIR